MSGRRWASVAWQARVLLARDQDSTRIAVGRERRGLPGRREERKGEDWALRSTASSLT